MVTTLVQQAQKGDLRAFSAVIERYRPAIAALAYGHVAQSDDVEDIVQEVVIAVFLKLKSLSEPERFSGWLRQIVHNVCISRLRRRRSWLTLEDIDEQAAAIPSDERRILDQIVVSEMLAKLSPPQRLVLLLCSTGHYTHGEAAQMLGIPVATLRSRLQNAKKIMAKETGTMTQQEPETPGPIRWRLGHDMPQVNLSEEAELVAQHDFLHGLVDILHVSLGDVVRAMYLVEIFAGDDFLPLCVIFKDGFDDGHRDRVMMLLSGIMRLVRYRYTVDPLYVDAEVPFYDTAEPVALHGAYPCTPLIREGVKSHSLFLWGEDIRPRIVLVHDRDLLRADVLTPCWNWLKQTHTHLPDRRHPLDHPLHYPLQDPAPAQDDRGFGDLFTVSTRIFHLARALIFLETERYVFDQMQIAAEYVRHVGSRWSELVQQVADARFADLPERERKKHWLAACRQTTAFENAFIEMVAGKGVELTGVVTGL